MNPKCFFSLSIVYSQKSNLNVCELPSSYEIISIRETNSGFPFGQNISTELHKDYKKLVDF